MRETVATDHDNRKLPKGAAVAFGFFDGLHLGHQRLMDRLFEIAKEKGYTSMVYTFSNHPYSVLAHEHPPMLFTPEEKWRALRLYGAEHVYMVPFTKELASTEYDRFIQNMMCTIPVCDIVIGFNYRMGRNGLGTPGKLRILGERLGFGVHVVEPLMYRDAPVSSTRIRECIQAGNLEEAGKMLGRPYTVCGRINAGYRLGARLGFPTANMEFPPDKVIVPNGVYATEALMDGKTYPAVTNVGTRPTVSELGRVGIETHLLCFNADIYGKTLEVRFWDRIREELKFETMEALSEQIRRDIIHAKDFFRRDGIDSK